MSIADYLRIVATVQERTPDWRVGQTYFNVLTEARPDLAEKVRGTHLDPFHEDQHIGTFIAFLHQNWEAAS